MIAYCAFCRTTLEEKAAMQINRLYGGAGIEAVAPVRILKERRRGVVSQVRKPLLPGYVLIYSNERLQPSRMRTVENVLRLLCYPGGEYELKGDDLAYANFVYGNRGVIGISNILCQGKEAKVLSGPLEDCQGIIVRLDQRKQRVWMRVRFDGVEREISLSANILSTI
jgi:transcription termination/antitermination protein NusG